MQGPYRIGSLGSPVTPAEGDWERTRLVRGERYRVIKPFRDADGDEHSIGQEWIFVSTLFSKFDDELALCIRDGSGEEWKIPLIWKPDRHMDVIENWQRVQKGTMSRPFLAIVREPHCGNSPHS